MRQEGEPEPVRHSLADGRAGFGFWPTLKAQQGRGVKNILSHLHSQTSIEELKFNKAFKQWIFLVVD